MLVGKVVVAVVTQEGYDILPVAGLLVFHICNSLVYHHIGLRKRHDGYAADTDIDLVAQQVASLGIVEESIIIFEHVGVYGISGVVRLECEQIIGCAAALVRQQAVVGTTVAKEQQIFGCSRSIVRAVIKHLHQTTIGCCIGCSRRKFVINLVGGNHGHSQAIHCAVRFGKTLGRSQEFAARRNYYNHIGLPQ